MTRPNGSLAAIPVSLDDLLPEGQVTIYGPPGSDKYGGGPG